MVEAFPAVGATTLLYSTASFSITILRCLRLVVRMIEAASPHSSPSLLVALLRDLYFYHIIGAFPNAAHDLLLSLSGNKLINPYWSSATPETLEYPDDTGDTTFASDMTYPCRFGVIQTACCMMVDRSSPPDNARETAPSSTSLDTCRIKSPIRVGMSAVEGLSGVMARVNAFYEGEVPTGNPRGRS